MCLKTAQFPRQASINADIGVARNNDQPTILTNSMWIHFPAPRRRHDADSAVHAARLRSAQLFANESNSRLAAIKYMARDCRRPHYSAEDPVVLYASTILASAVRDEAE